MIQIGKYNTLTIMRETDPGLFLSDSEENEILLPHKYKPAQFEIGDSLKVFVYLDHEERPIATTETPLITLNEFAYLHCDDVNKFGAFLDWGVTKQLFVPFREQAVPMQEGKGYVVYMYLDPVTQRLVASSKTKKFLDNETITEQPNEQVNVLVTRITDQGASVIINGKHEGLIFQQDIFEDIRPGDEFKAYIKKVRPDKKIDVVLHAPGYKSIEPNAEYVLQELKAAGGFLPLHDKSDPETIKNELGLSKKSFKKAIGSLYKDKKINIQNDGITLL